MREPQEAADGGDWPVSAPKAPGPAPAKVSAPAVLLAVFTIGTCGLIYELLAGTLASYVLGDSMTQFSTIIGVYLFAMGVGAWLSGFVQRRVVVAFIEVEIAVALIGGGSAAMLFLAFSRLTFFPVALYGIVFIIGCLVGLEIPLLMRILKDQFDLKDLVSRVLTVDYLGALVASLLFPMFLVPRLGLVRASFAVGAVNAVVALWCTFILAGQLKPAVRRMLQVECVAVLALMLGGLVAAKQITSIAEDSLYAAKIVFSKTTPYQRLVITQNRQGFRLFINGALQFASNDEHRYHEALVHPVMSAAEALSGRPPARVLILGGGDGLALREVLRYPSVKKAVLVDLDPEMTKLAKSFVLFTKQNKNALADPRVETQNADAFVWLRKEGVKRAPFDVIIVDFPDPNNFSLGKLYTRRMYRQLAAVLAEDGALAVQSTSPTLARKSFWTVTHTLEGAGFSTHAYHALVPSFGDWGYVLAAKRPFSIPDKLPSFKLKYLNPATLAAMFIFPEDTKRMKTEVNRLDNQILVQTYSSEWARWF